jgi:heme a synthase
MSVNSGTGPHPLAPPRSLRFAPWRHRLARLLVAATLLLILAGGLVTSTGSGLAVPDWPLSYGMLMPPMVGGIFYEHGHRMVASGVGLLTLVFALWTAAAEPRRGFRRLAWAGLAVVIVQGVLGGLTVLFLLPTAVSVAHACLAQTFFCLVIALAYASSREWLDAPPPRADPSGLRRLALATSMAVWLQLLVGAVMRHMGAGLAIPDFPFAFGQLVPAFTSVAIGVHFSHRVGAVVVLALIARLALRAHRFGDPLLARPALGAFLLALCQVGLGGATILSARAVVPTTLHVITGAGLLGSCWFTTLRAWRRYEPTTAPARQAAAAADAVPAA